MAEDGWVPPQAAQLMAAIVYLPCYPELGADGRDRLLAALSAAAGLGAEACADLAADPSP